MPLERSKPPNASGKTGAPIAASGRTGAPIVGPPRAMEEAVRENLGRTHLSLRAIREELEMFEKEIKWRDERLGQLEQELQQERSRTRGSESGSGGERMREARQQLEQHAQALRERDARIQALVLTERELLGRVQTLTHERGKSAQALADMVKQIQEQQRRTQLLEEKLRQAQQESQARAAAARAVEAPARSGWSALGGPARLGIVLAVLVIAGASIALAAMTLMRAEPRYRVAGQLVVSASQAGSVEDEIKDEPLYGHLEKIETRPLGAQAAGLTLAIGATATQQDQARRELDALGRSLVARLTPPPAALPDTSAQRAELERRLGSLDEQMSVLTTQPAQAALDRELGLLKSWRELLAERQSVESQLKLLRPRLASTRPAAGQIQIEADILAKAEAADTQLQTHVQALAAKEEQLRTFVLKGLDAGEPVFSRLPGDLETAAKGVDEASREASDAAVVRASAEIAKSLSEYQSGLGELQEARQTARQATGDAQSDILAVQSKLEAAVRAFLDRGKSLNSAIEKAIESLGEGGEEPTQRIVLRDGLSRRLGPVREAQASIAPLLSPLIAADNPELVGLTQAVTGLRGQVGEHKERIASSLRQDALAAAIAAHDREVSAARAEHERWLQRAAELDGELLQKNREALALLPRMDGERSAAHRRAELYEERSQILGELAKLSRSEADTLARQEARFVPWYIPAEATPLPVSPRAQLGQAMLLGSIPLGIGALLLVALWAGQLYFRSRQLASDYERLLREAGGGR